MTFPHDSVERGIALSTCEPAMAEALRDLARAAGAGGFQYVPRVITFADGAIYPVAPIKKKHLLLFVDVTDGSIVTRLPSSTDPDPAKRPVLGDVVTITDLVGVDNAGESITIDGNGNAIEDAATYNISSGGNQFQSITLMFTSPTVAPGTLGWRIIWTFSGLGIPLST
jgi:hypothetical protein